MSYLPKTEVTVDFTENDNYVKLSKVEVGNYFYFKRDLDSYLVGEIESKPDLYIMMHDRDGNLFMINTTYSQVKSHNDFNYLRDLAVIVVSKVHIKPEM